jgi:hypothetical protein
MVGLAANEWMQGGEDGPFLNHIPDGDPIRLCSIKFFAFFLSFAFLRVLCAFAVIVL